MKRTDKVNLKPNFRTARDKTSRRGTDSEREREIV
jgi:hypothetical protein